MRWGADDLMDVTSGIAWAILIGVATALAFFSSRFSLRTLRFFTCLIAIILTITITRFGLTHPEYRPTNLVDSFLSGADRVTIALLHPFWPGKVIAPGVAGRWIIAVALLLGYRQLEARALGRQAPELDLSAIGRTRPAGHSNDHPAGWPSHLHGNRQTASERQVQLAAELRFRLPTMEVRSPSILPGGARTNALASIAESSGVSGAGMVGAVVRFAGMIWPGAPLVRVRSWVESDDGARITVLLENVKTGLPIASKTVAGREFKEAASMVTGYIAREIFAMDPTVPKWCYGMADGRDLGAMQLARLERYYAPCTSEVCESRKMQILILASETGTVRTAGIVRYELAQLLALDDQNLESFRLHALNRELHPRFYRGRYRFAMSLEMIANPEHYLPYNAAMLRKLADTLEIISRSGPADSMLQGYVRDTRKEADLLGALSPSSGAALCAPLPPKLARKLLGIAGKDLRDVRAHLSLSHVAGHALRRRDERAVWLPHRKHRTRKPFQDGVCVAELLVAIRCRLHPGAPDGTGRGWFRHGRALLHLRRAARITWCVTGKCPSLVVAVLKNPCRDWRDWNTAEPQLDLLSRACLRLPPWLRSSRSWQAAYNTACLYAALAERARRDGAPVSVLRELERRVIVSLRNVLGNPDSELERAWDWIDSDPDFRVMRDHHENFPAFAEFLADLKEQEYPASGTGQCLFPHAHPDGISAAAARRLPYAEPPIFSPVSGHMPADDGDLAYFLVQLTRQ
jgi:hypothetical protein